MEVSKVKRWTVPLVLVISFAAIFLLAGDQKQAPRLPGPESGKSYLLPNGWSLSPAGRHVQVGDFPMALVLHPDGKHLLVSNNGYGKQSVDVINIEQGKAVHSSPVEKAWLGLALNADGTRAYAGGGLSNTVLAFSFDGGKLNPLPPMTVGRPLADIFPGGLCLTGNRIFVANNLNGEVAALDSVSGKVVGTVKAGDYPYTCVASADGSTIFASMWAGSQVVAIDTASLQVKARIPTDDHPNAMILSKDGKRLFVANANANTVSAIDIAAGKAQERISVALYPNSPAGSTTNALTLSPDGATLFVANADNNDLAVVDIREPGDSKVLGFIPVGWYPTALAISADGKTLFVANGKGNQSAANPKGPVTTVPRTPATQYIGGLFLGSVSIIPVPGRAELAKYTEQVYANAPYSEKKRLAVPFKGESAIPKKVGDKGPIEYVIYIIKENRTYDQVFGDIKEGNGDPSLTLFGEQISPNHHALAREFVLLDNFYVDAEVSADGHNWSMGAYATDYVEKIWPSQYSGRRRVYDFEASTPNVAPSAGYIWDACKRAGISYRSYGEWVANGPKPGDPATPKAAALEGHIDTLYRGWDMQYSDVDRAKRFLSEVARFEKEGGMPRFQVVRMGNDHTQATKAGVLTPSAYVAQNDLALGMLVEGISKSSFWPKTAIFVVEDDAQNGLDHVDAHRSIAFAISPYVRRRMVDSTMYSTSSMLRTMELILGIPPMSQYDAAAAPLFASFGTKPDLAPFRALPARVSLTEINPPNAPGRAASALMDFEEADRAPDLELNEILWKAIKGKDSVMPAPIRSAFVRPIEGDRD
jgi:YVTN family beta-propeller protein